MAVIRLAGFAGENRAIHARLLPDNVGTVSRNQKPGRGDLRPWKAPVQVATVPAGRQTIYRMGRDVDDEARYWLSWTTVVHAVRGFDAEDTTERTYYTGDGAPKVTDNLALDGTGEQVNPTASRPLGIPAPATTPLVSVSNLGTSAATDETYFYVYTYVNDWGWESAPSPVSAMVTRKSDGTTTISGFAALPSGNYGIDRIRIYRTQTGASGATEFYFLRELGTTVTSTAGTFTKGYTYTITSTGTTDFTLIGARSNAVGTRFVATGAGSGTGTATYITVDTSSTTDDNRDLGEVLATTTWLAPPEDLSCLTSLWNGMLAGVSGNSVRICEAYVPYAWPIAYDVVPPDGKPVALGVFGQALLVLTTGRPLLVSGSSPDGMDQQPLEIPQGCVSAQSVVSMGNGVAWASEDGLCWYGSGGARILTAGVMMREDWQKLNPHTIIGQMYEGLYFGSYAVDGVRKGFFIDPNSQGGQSGIYFLEQGYEALHFDQLKDQLYVLDAGAIKKWDAGTTAMTAAFKSKVFSAPKPTNFAAAEVVASDYPVTLKLYADGVLKHTQSVAAQSPFRLPAGYLAQSWQIELTGANAVQQVAIATSVTELTQV